MKDISIVIPTYKRNDVLLTSLTCLTELNLCVDIFVINDDKEKKINLPSEILEKVQVLQNPKKGVASARNFGASLSSSKWILFMDDDININIAVYNHINKLIKENKNIEVLNVNWEYPPQLQNQLSKSIFGRYMIKKDLISLSGYSNHKWTENKLYKTDENASYFLLIKRETFNKSGGYNEQFPHAGFEDFDFSQRLNKVFAQKYVDMRVTVWHNEYDRTDFSNWLKRRKNEGETRAIAVKKIGYINAAVKYSVFKEVVFTSCSIIFKLLLFVYKFLPNKKNYDKFNHKFIDLLVGTQLYKGYKRVK